MTSVPATALADSVALLLPIDSPMRSAVESLRQAIAEALGDAGPPAGR